MRREDKKQKLPFFKFSVASDFICHAALLQLCFTRFNVLFYIVLLVRGKHLKMRSLLTRRFCTTFYVLQVTSPCIYDKTEDLKLCSGKGFCFVFVAECGLKHCSAHASLSNSKKLQSQMCI